MSQKKRALVVDDEANIRELAALYLGQEGFDVKTCGDGEEALRSTAGASFDLVVLDVMLPGRDGLEVCREIRRHSQVPILMLTARDDITDKVVGLELGADDYLTKPFHPKELVARAKALVRRSQVEPDAAETLDFDGIRIDIPSREVTVGAAPVQLRPKEFDLLVLLARTPGRVFTREEILDKVWGYDFAGYSRTVDVHMQHLRDRLQGGGAPREYLETVWGVGYRFRAAPAGTSA
ncbi:MAG: response regulator [Candidatus Dormibacteria bacterium]